MTSLPSASSFTDNNTTQGQFKTAITNLITYLNERLEIGSFPIKADVISEATAGLGVTIDSVLLKDGYVQALINELTGSNIASAGTTNIGAATGNTVNITGTTTITSLGTANSGIKRELIFAGALTLTYNATSLILPTGQNIVTEAGDNAEFVSLGSGNWKCIKYTRISGVPLNTAFSLMPKQIILSNNGADAANDIDFSAGNFQFSDGSGIASLSAMTKRLDAAWAAGTNQGGLDTGSEAINTWYHCYAIYNPSTKVSDAIFSTNATSPSLPGGYTKFKRLGAIFNTSGSTILPFTQTGNHFNLVTVFPSISGVSQTANNETLRSILTPLGVKTNAKFCLQGGASSAGSAHIKAYSADIVSATLSTADGQCYISNGVTVGLGYVEAITNTSSQIKTNMVNTSGTPTINITITILGWEEITI